MKDKMNLNEWLSVHDNQEEMRALFRRMDAKMKYIHGKGYYIMDFNPSKIDVENADINFQMLGPMTNENYQTLMDHNIYTLSFFQIASYSNCLNYLKPTFLLEHFEEFVSYLPQDDIGYYRSVILDKKYYYLTDYIKILDEARNKEYASEGDGMKNTNQRTYTKATAVGKMYREGTYINDAAFTNAVQLTVIVVATIFITLIGLIIKYA